MINFYIREIERLVKQGHLNAELGAEMSATLTELTSLDSRISRVERKFDDAREINYLLDRISDEARPHVVNNKELRKLFETRVCNAYVMSVDIRGSTTLMLKAKTPELFAEFINAVVRDLKQLITYNNGIYDKFTGDGVLAFFPEFYTGENAAFYALTAANQCHAAFKKQYRNYRHIFKSVVATAGIGIGIDYGEVHLLRMAEGLTVVGEPVVYACRLGGAPVDSTLMNQPAYQNAREKDCGAFYYSETQLDFKHEGAMLAYRTNPNGETPNPPAPRWRMIVDGNPELPNPELPNPELPNPELPNPELPNPEPPDAT